MSEYRLFHITSGGDMSKCQRLEAENDAAAIKMAENIRDTSQAELWCEKRMVRLFKQRENLTDFPTAGSGARLFSSW